MHNESDFLKQEIIDRVQLKGMCEDQSALIAIVSRDDVSENH